MLECAGALGWSKFICAILTLLRTNELEDVNEKTTDWRNYLDNIRLNYLTLFYICIRFYHNFKGNFMADFLRVLWCPVYSFWSYESFAQRTVIDSGERSFENEYCYDGNCLPRG